MQDKLKESAILLGGLLSTVLLFLGSVGISLEWFTTESIDAFVQVLIAGVLFLGSIYAVYKNTYVVTKKARKQSEELKKKGLK